MEMNKLIETLSDLTSYIEDEWDWGNHEIKEDGENKIKALNEAIRVITSNNIVGSLELNNKKYSIVG